MSDLNELISVNVNLRAETISKLDYLCHFYETFSKTVALVRSVGIAHRIAKEMDAGASIRIYRQDGSISELVVE
jgi:hypothetical protein